MDIEHFEENKKDCPCYDEGYCSLFERTIYNGHVNDSRTVSRECNWLYCPAYYWVKVRRTPYNVEHHAIFYTGLLKPDGTPGERHSLFCQSYSCVKPYDNDEVYYMKVIRKLDTREEEIK